MRHRARRGTSLWGSQGYEGEEDEGAASIEAIASYGTRFAICDLRACHLQEALPSPPVLTPCDDRMLPSQAQGQARLVLVKFVERAY